MFFRNARRFQKSKATLKVAFFVSTVAVYRADWCFRSCVRRTNGIHERRVTINHGASGKIRMRDAGPTASSLAPFSGGLKPDVEMLSSVDCGGECR